MALTVPSNRLTATRIKDSFDQVLFLDNASGIAENTLKIVSTDIGKSALQIDDEKILIKGVDTSNAAAFEVQQTGGTSIFKVAADTPALTINAATVTLTQDTNFVTSGGTNGFSVDSTTLSVDGSNNRVGIGTAAPDGTLHVHTATAGSVTAHVDMDDLVVENSGNAGISILSPNASASSLAFGSPADSLGAAIQWKSADNLLSIITHNADDMICFRTGDSSQEVMRMKADGKVGIGTTAPEALLDVNEETDLGSSEGDSIELMRFGADTSHDDELFIRKLRISTASSGSGWESAQYRIQARVDSTYMAWIGFNGETGSGTMNQGLAFGTGGDSDDMLVTEKMRIEADGKVGIGTSSPTTKLQVNGSFTTGLVTITATDAITAAEHAGRTNLLGEVGGNALVTLTLPDASGTGNVYRFTVSVVNTSSYVFKVLDGDTTIDGQIILTDADSTTPVSYVTAATTDTITLNGTTTGGGAIGDYIELIDIAEHQWAVSGMLTCAAGSNVATMMSATVS